MDTRQLAEWLRRMPCAAAHVVLKEYHGSKISFSVAPGDVSALMAAFPAAKPLADARAVERGIRFTLTLE